MSSSKSQTQVLIVGAGPTGLVLGLWLTRLGVAVRIVDKSAEPGTTSRALGVQARTLELYRQAGLADAVVEGGVQTAAVNLWVKGVRTARVPFRDIGKGLSPFPYLLIYPQDAHERLLIERLEPLGVKVERPVELSHFDQHVDGVRATLKRPDGSEETCEAAYLAGCDGARSFVREASGIGFPGGTYSRLFYVADVEVDGLVTDDELHVDLDSVELLAVFPMKGTGRARLVGTLGDDAERARDQMTFDDVSDRTLKQLKLTITKVNWFSTYRVHHRVANRFRDGRVFLLGDAGHIHSPVGAQGMNTGIGDAINLAWKLAAVLSHGAADRLLDTYETERRRFALGLVASTDRAFTLATRQSPLAAFVRTRVFPLIALVLTRLPPTRRLIFRTISQIALNYRSSLLSSGKAGRVQGGDRLPWVQLAPGDYNFTPLDSMDWQVHVYGEPRRGVAGQCLLSGIPLHQFPWQPAMKKAGLAQGAVYLIRPDGYVALAAPNGGPDQIRQYFAAGIARR